MKLIITLFILIISPHLALATDGQSGSGLRQLVTGGFNTIGRGAFVNSPTQGVPSLLEVVGSGIGIILGLIGVLFVIHMIVAGFQWMNAGGNEEQVTKAQTRIKNSTIGIVIVVAAYLVTLFVVTGIQTIINTPE